MLTQKETLVRISDVLSEALGRRPRKVEPQRADRDGGVRVVALADSHRFVIEARNKAGTEQIVAAVERLQRYVNRLEKHAVPLLSVPYMGPVGRRICAEKGVSWLDLSGNARIQVPGLRVVIEGRPNKFKQRGRPASVFAPKSARIARWFLMNPARWGSQREIARESRMDEGFTSRIVSRLESQGFLQRDAKGGLKVRDPRLLLDAWREEHDFTKNDVVAGHISARSSEALLGTLAAALRERKVRHATTGLAGAWLITRHAGFRIVTVYAAEQPSPEIRQALGFREEPRGANVWWVVPRDEGVFGGAAERYGVMCAHPVQVYVDLKAHPERAREAAERLRSELLTFSNGG